MIPKEINRGGVLHDTSTYQVDTKSERNFGVDLLRIFSMLMIVMLHLMSHGGIVDASHGSTKYIVGLLYILTYCSVDIFALISGFVGYNDVPKKPNIKKIILLWLQVLFYSVVITLLTPILLKLPIENDELLTSVFPIITKRYWYISAYIGLLIFAPLLNIGLSKISDMSLTAICCVMFFFFSVAQLFAEHYPDPFGLQTGYSVIWLCSLYVLGAWIKKIAASKVSTRNCIIVIIICFALTCFIKCVFGIKEIIRYISPTLLLMSMSFVLAFSRIKISKRIGKIISYISSLVLSVYLITEHPIIRDNYIINRFSYIAEYPFYVVPTVILIIAVLICIACIIIESVRAYVFSKIPIERIINRIRARINKE